MMIQVFSKQWFKKYNKQLCWIANSFIGDFVFKISKMGHDKKKYGKITEMHPNAITHKQRLLYNFEKHKTEQEYTTQFFSRNEYALRLQKVFYPIWLTFHCWDMLIANPFKPAWNLGFDTLTVYPDVDPESTSVDGEVRRHSPSTAFLTIRNGSGTYASDNTATACAASINNDSSLWSAIIRSIFLFDTSALTSEATITNTVFSIYGTAKADTASISMNLGVFTSIPASNTAVATGDYSNIGTTLQSAVKTYAAYSISSYNNFTLNATGRGNVSKTGISKFGCRNSNYDAAGVVPSWNGSNQSCSFTCYMADNGSNKPKLVVTYTTGTHYNLVCSVGNFTLSGQAVSLKADRKITCETGNYALTGIDVGLAKGYKIACECGNYTLTGVSVGLRVARKLVCSAGSFTYTGVAVGLVKGYKITCECGNYTLTGIDVALKMARKLACSAGSFTYTGIDVGITKGYRLVCGTGRFILTGIEVLLKRSMRNKSKVSTIFTNRSKKSTSFTNKAKVSTSFTNRSR